jgi:glycosyltransferase involved in cell wall biosynthesis
MIWRASCRGGAVAEQSMRILQVSTTDIAGGAERVALTLFQAFRERKHDSWLAVGNKRGNDPDVLPICNPKTGGGWSHFWWQKYSRLQIDGGHTLGGSLLRRLVRVLADPGGSFDTYCGVENFRFPGTWQLLRMTPKPPDIFHCHNLHRDYFDLRALPSLCEQVPVVLTLHDAWLLSGHCSHSFDCERWKTGCGNCPDLSIYPAIRRDATAYNWSRKKDIYAKSCVYLATPSRWLMQKVEQSILAPAIADARVIPNGVDLSIFYPGDTHAARAALGLPLNAIVLLFAARGIRGSWAKDYQTMRDAVDQVAEHLTDHKIIFVALGENAPAERIGRAEVHFVPYQKDPELVSHYYQAADLYLHAAKVDTFPTTVLEALACGTPVVATDVGGIPEQIRGLKIADYDSSDGDPNKFGIDEATGILVPSRSAESMARSIVRLLKDDRLRLRLGKNAARDAASRFDLNRQVNQYLAWYGEIQEHFKVRLRNRYDVSVTKLGADGSH